MAVALENKAMYNNLFVNTVDDRAKLKGMLRRHSIWCIYKMEKYIMQELVWGGGGDLLKGAYFRELMVVKIVLFNVSLR